jgi:transcriptional regulator GlxA family with amidase domain
LRPALLVGAALWLLAGTAGGPAAAREAPAGKAGDPPAPAAARIPWERLPSPGDIPRNRPLAAGFLVVNGVYDSELMAPYDVFHHTPLHVTPGIEVFTVSPDGRPISTFEGLRLVPRYSFANAPAMDILVVPSSEGSMDRDLKNRRLVEWVRRAGGKARFVVSLCDGAFVLAAAGLLDGHACTTFPTDQDRFASMFPEIDLRREPTFVHDGKAITSQGGADSYLAALYLVDHLYGEEVAREVGKGLLIPWPQAVGSLPVVVIDSSDSPDSPDSSGSSSPYR